MAEAHLDHPGEVTWFAGKGPKQPLGPCDHACLHEMGSAIGWGPDYEHYCLVECADCGCRSWTVEYPPPFGAHRPKYRERGYVQMAQKAERSTP